MDFKENISYNIATKEKRRDEKKEASRDSSFLYGREKSKAINFLSRE